MFLSFFYVCKTSQLYLHVLLYLFYIKHCLFLFYSIRLQRFTKSKVDPLQKKLDSLSADIQTLVQSAPSGANIGGMDTDLEGLQDSWSELNEKVTMQLIFELGIYGIEKLKGFNVEPHILKVDKREEVK